MDVKHFQHSFKNLMLDHPDSLKNPPGDLAEIFKSDDIALSERLAVYRNNIVGGLSDVIVSTFPLLQSLVGENFLRGMAREFVLKSPPTAGGLNQYGDGFNNFISTFKPAQDMPYLADIALLEIETNNAYYAPDDTPLTTEHLSQIPVEKLENLPLETRPSVSLVKSAFPLMDIRKMCLHSYPKAQPDMEQGCHLMIHRPAFDVIFTPLEEDEFEAISHLQTGAPLGAIVENTLSKYPRFDIHSFLQKHLSLETFQGLPSNSKL